MGSYPGDTGSLLPLFYPTKILTYSVELICVFFLFQLYINCVKEPKKQESLDLKAYHFIKICVSVL